MKKLNIVFIILLFLSNTIHSRTNELEGNLNSYLRLIKQAQDFNLKSISNYSGKRIIYKADFDSLGNIKSIIDYHYKMNKDFERINFVCENGLILEYEELISFQKNSIRKYYFDYDTLNRPKTLISTFNIKGTTYIKADTTQIFYTKSGKIDYKTFRNSEDTVRYFYNTDDSLLGNSSSRSYRIDKIMDQRVFNEFDCLVGYYDGSEMRSFDIRDDKCNLLGWEFEILFNGKWVSHYKYERKFKDGIIVSETYYYTDRFNKNKMSKIQSKFVEKLTYQYNNKGLLTKTMFWNEKGRLKKEKRREYEYYE